MDLASGYYLQWRHMMVKCAGEGITTCHSFKRKPRLSALSQTYACDQQVHQRDRLPRLRNNVESNRIGTTRHFGGVPEYEVGPVLSNETGDINANNIKTNVRGDYGSRTLKRAAIVNSK